MSSLLRIILFLVLFAGSIVSQAFAASNTVLLFGDSIVAGYGLAQEHSLSVQLQEYLTQKNQNVKVINGGVSGDTTAAGLTRLSWTLKRAKPDIVVLALGGNDVLRGIDPKTSGRNLNEMLKILRAEGVKIVFTQVKAPSSLGKAYGQELTDVYESLAKQYEIQLYPFLLEPVFGRPTFMLPDGVHPSAAGVKQIAATLGESLLDRL